jgi:hypothetical protein
MEHRISVEAREAPFDITMAHRDFVEIMKCER